MTAGNAILKTELVIVNQVSMGNTANIKPVKMTVQAKACAIKKKAYAFVKMVGMVLTAH
jgi:hypothetical protein